VQLVNTMIFNNIKKRIKQIKLYDTISNQTMLPEDHIRILIDTIPKKDLQNPSTTYCDPQCGTGSILLILADILMESLAKDIPNELDRLTHIFSKQLFGSDIDNTQVKIAHSNLKRAINDNKFNINVSQFNCMDINNDFDYVISNLDYSTINTFIPKWRKQCKKLIVAGRANQNSYTENKIHELSEYRYLALTGSFTPQCMMVFEPTKYDNHVTISNSEISIVVDNPPFLPNHDLVQYQYALEVLSGNFKGHDAEYGSYYTNSTEVLDNPGNTPLIFQVGKEGEEYRKIVYVSKRIITEREGVGKHKIVISKNGGRNHQSPIKYAGPKYGTGHNALWIEVEDKEEAEKFIKYWYTEHITMLCKALSATSPANGVAFWKRIPTINNYKKVKQIYDKYYKS
jgi:methylase of polypeptide subunit release factors